MNRFATFLFAPGQADVMRTEFSPILQGTNISRSDKATKAIATYKKVPGIYFWVLRHHNAEYRIYIGKTNSMAYRLLNYISDFQPHSPNDFKLRIFAAYAADVTPEATFDLYFKRTDLASLTAAENAAIETYRPLLHELPAPSLEAKEGLKRAFALYYRSSFEQCLAPVAQCSR